MENSEYLTKQIITYIGNKRTLLKDICEEVKNIYCRLGRKLVCADLFSGSGIVARGLKQFSSEIIANDLEEYSRIINSCYLSNKKDLDIDRFRKYLTLLNEKVTTKPIVGIITQNYAAVDENNIQKSDRLFYTKENAVLIDTYRHYISELPAELQKYFLAQLLVEASVHVNTSGVFKGFYKNKNTGVGQFGGTAKSALSRILGKIQIRDPILSNFESDYKVYQMDAQVLIKYLRQIDVLYLDPPYNQHPYGSNYFMLNVIAQNRIGGKQSKVSGIPNDWNRSQFNNPRQALPSLEQIVSCADAKYIIISYNNEGFIELQDMIKMLNQYGKVTYKQMKYNTFRGSRNLGGREMYTSEYIFTLEKR